MSTFKKLALILLLFAAVSAVSSVSVNYPFYILEDNSTVYTKINVTSGTSYLYISKNTGISPSWNDTFGENCIAYFPFKLTQNKSDVSPYNHVSTEIGTISYNSSGLITTGSGRVATDIISDVSVIIEEDPSVTTGSHTVISQYSSTAPRWALVYQDSYLKAAGASSIIPLSSNVGGDMVSVVDTFDDIVYCTENQGGMVCDAMSGAGRYLYIGGYSSTSDYAYSGVISSVKVYNSSISENERTNAFANSPVITEISVINSTTLRITLESIDTLIDYNLEVNASLLNITSSELKISELFNSSSNVSTEVLEITNRTIILSYNSTNVHHSVINWGDGNTTIIYDENTELTYTYEYDNNFSIGITGYNSDDEVVALNTTTAYVLLNYEYLENYYTLLVANPYNEDLTDYPLNMTFDSENFDWWNTNITPLGTNIYFRTNDTIYEHYIAEWSAGSTTGTIYVNISEIPANDYLTFYMCFASYDYPQYEVDTETEYTVLWTITDFQQQEEAGTFERVSTEVSEYQNITVLFVDEQTLISGTLKIGTIAFTDENGDRVVYSFDTPVMSSLEVSAATANGTILVATSDGITRELTYSNSSGLNVVTLPNSYTVPITISTPGDVEIYTNGYLVTTATAPADIYLALNGKYDIYLDGEALRTDYVVTKEDILYETITSVKTVDTTVVDYHLDGETITATISATSTATLEIEGTTNYTIENVTTITGIAKDSHYKLYNSSGEVVEEGIFYGIDVGYLGLLNSQFSEKTSAIIALFVIGVTLLTGTYVSLHYTMTLAAMEVALFSYIDLIPFDPLTKSILTLIAFAVALLMWVKR